MEVDFYVISVWNDGGVKYLFNAHTLVLDRELAHRFNSLSAAKRYFLKTTYVGSRYQITPVYLKETPVDPRNLGAIVE